MRVDRVLVVVAGSRCGVDALRRLHVVVQVAVAEVAEVDEPHARERRAAARRRCRRRTPGCADTGSEMSCLMFGPSSRLRQRNRSRARATARATAPGSRPPPHRGSAPCSSAASQQRFEALRARAASPSLSLTSSSTRPGAHRGSGRGSCGKCLRHQARAQNVAHHLEAGQPGAQARLRQLQQRHAGRAGRAGGQRRDAARPAAGSSFIVAAVMMPSVPSLPINRSRRS